MNKADVIKIIKEEYARGLAGWENPMSPKSQLLAASYLQCAHHILSRIGEKSGDRSKRVATIFKEVMK